MATETLRPDAAGDEESISLVTYGNGGTYHYEAVDEVEADTTTYVSSDVGVYERDLYNLPASSGSGTINFIEIFIRCIEIFGAGYAKPSLKSGTTVDDGTEVSLSGSWVTYSEQWATNPDDEAAWEWADIDDLQIGVSLKGVAEAEARCTQVYVEVDYTLAQAVGNGAIAITGSLNRKTSKAIGAGSIAISGALSAIYRQLAGVGSGSVAIAGAVSSILTHFLSVGVGSITIAGTLGRLIKIAIGSGAISISSSLGRKIALSVGSGAVSIAGTLGRLIKLVVGKGSISIAGILSRFFFIDWGKNAIIHAGSIPSPIMLVENVTKGDALGYDSGWKQAWAKSGSVVQFRCVAAEDGIKNQTITAYFGTVLLGKRFAGGIAGRAIYVEEGTSKGRYTLTKPTTAGDADTVIGYMLTGSLGFIHGSLNDDSLV